MINKSEKIKIKNLYPVSKYYKKKTTKENFLSTASTNYRTNINSNSFLESSRKKFTEHFNKRTKSNQSFHINTQTHQNRDLESPRPNNSIIDYDLDANRHKLINRSSSLDRIKDFRTSQLRNIYKFDCNKTNESNNSILIENRNIKIDSFDRLYASDHYDNLYFDKSKSDQDSKINYNAIEQYYSNEQEQENLNLYYNRELFGGIIHCVHDNYAKNLEKVKQNKYFDNQLLYKGIKEKLRKKNSKIKKKDPFFSIGKQMYDEKYNNEKIEHYKIKDHSNDVMFKNNEFSSDFVANRVKDIANQGAISYYKHKMNKSIQNFRKGLKDEIEYPMELNEFEKNVNKIRGDMIWSTIKRKNPLCCEGFQMEKENRRTILKRDETIPVYAIKRSK